ncbi:MAG: hypothetical protein KF819_04435 [Labilithrix sp.]|nr:hypothetical protein [Labilithrix sp.]
MASNFVWRMLVSPYRMEQGLADCNADPDVPCVDAVAALSDLDMGRVLDVEFVRMNAGRLERSRRMRVVSVDSGHAIASQATTGPNGRGPNLTTCVGRGPAMLWRLEMGGSLAARLEAGPGAMAGLVAWSASNGRGPATRPPPGACTDLNAQRWKCEGGATFVCRDQAWVRYALGCAIPEGAALER